MKKITVCTLVMFFCVLAAAAAQVNVPDPGPAPGDIAAGDMEPGPVPPAADGAGTQDTGEADDGPEYYPVNGLETWQYDLDISGYPAGKYNIIVRGTDIAGNEYFEGPFNILIDPESDKPVTNISNPEPDMRVGGNLNIVGTCVDDDAVGRVEVRINDGEYMQAEGTEFWSFYLRTDDMEDGEYTITARGIDEGGTSGGEAVVRFVLDKNRPVNEISSFENGALLNGKVVLEGTVRDLNGIAGLEFSTDGGDTFEEVPIKTKKNEPEAFFSIKVDTNKLDDGPRIYWFRSTDRTGSSAVSAFLFFVDNKAPVLDILFPTEDMQVNGKFRVVGRVSDEVGVESLSFRNGRDEPVSIPLSIGDPYWFQDFDCTNQEKTDIVFTLTDKTGNTTESRMQLKLDAEGDAPVLELLTPENEAADTDGVLSGFVTDDDGVEELVYSIDGGSPVSVPARYSFQVSLGDLTPGSHRIDVHAVDIHGVAGEEKRVSFTTILDGPQISFDSFSLAEGDGTEALTPGMSVDTQKYKAINGRVVFQNGPDTALVKIQDGEKQNLSLKRNNEPGVMSFSIPLKGLASGFTSFELEASDKAGLTVKKTLYLMLQGIEPAAADSRLYYADERFYPDGKPGGLVKMQEGEEIVFLFNGSSVSGADLTSGEGFLRLDVRENLVILKAVSQGYSDSCRIKIEAAGGKDFTVGPFMAGVDNVPPRLSLESDIDGGLVGDVLEVTGNASDNIIFESLSYTLSGGSPVQLEIGEDGAFQASIPVEGEDDGGLVVTFTAEDRLGNRESRRLLLIKDTEAPSLIQITPLTELPANGKITFTGRTADNVGVQTVEFSSDGENYQPLKNVLFPAFPLDLTLFDQETTVYVFRVTDQAGHSASFSPDIDINSEGDVPVVQIQIPREGALEQNDFIISGMAFDDDNVSKILYRIDDGEFLELPGANNFEIPVSIRSIPDNGHSVEVKAVDPAGVESAAAVLRFNVSRSEPVSSLIAPSIDNTVRDTVEISGESSDANGISMVLISYDNGNTFNTAEIVRTAPGRVSGPDVSSGAGSETGPDVSSGAGSETGSDVSAGADGEAGLETDRDTDPENKSGEAEVDRGPVQWLYQFDTRLIADGTHSILIKAVDSNGVEGLYTSLINIDNTSPEIELTGIIDGTQIADILDLKGRVTDNIELADVKLELRYLGPGTPSGGAAAETVFGESGVPVSIDLPEDEILLEGIDLSGFPPGWINLMLSAVDRAGNRSSVSRNIEKIGELSMNRVAIFSPARGETVSGRMKVQGIAETLDPAARAALYIDGFPFTQLKLNPQGYFEVALDQEDIRDGSHQLAVELELEDGTVIRTEERTVTYRRHGPWVSISNFSAGDFAAERPWITGTSGYNYSVPEMDEKKLKAFQKQHEVDLIEVSLDNGRTFSRARGAGEWKFRLETQELPHGETGIIVRARFNDGEVAVSKTRVIVDETPPRVELLTPGEGMRFNDTISMSGTGSDASGLMDISVAIREGDKNRYQVPSFIQGLYIDSHFLGATYWELGAGLTFFDDNVKLQAQFGFAPPGRFTGAVAGVKLLANLAVLPYEYLFGYDWSFLSSSLAVGATFNYFSMSEGEVSFGDEALVLGALLAQIELVKAENPKWKMFSSFSIYTEGQLWFISSDIDGGVEGRVAFGLRSDIF